MNMIFIPNLCVFSKSHILLISHINALKLVLMLHAKICRNNGLQKYFNIQILFKNLMPGNEVNFDTCWLFSRQIYLRVWVISS